MSSDPATGELHFPPLLLPAEERISCALHSLDASVSGIDQQGFGAAVLVFATENLKSSK